MSRDANSGQVTIIPLENKLNFTPTQKIPTYAPLLLNGPGYAIYWDWWGQLVARGFAQCLKEYRKQNTKLPVKPYSTECNEIEETIKLHGNNR